ncbi:MAG: hypothetical protein JWO59_3150 [Chloroflexi bacterium]|nr:hypothetical protein [Chloroflexota bacterium]
MQEDRETRGAAAKEPARERSAGRPRHCWEIVRQIPGLHFNCEECYAYFVQQDCWTLWALRRPGFKPCCQKKGDCTECVVLNERMRPLVPEQIEIERKAPIRPTPTSAKRVCSYLQLYQGNEEVEGDNKNAAVARALQVRNADLRCRLRGVHLDMSYVNDVCVSRHVEECVFLDVERPEVRVRELPMAKQAGQPSVKRPLDKSVGTLPETGDSKSAVSNTTKPGR